VDFWKFQQAETKVKTMSHLDSNQTAESPLCEPTLSPLFIDSHCHLDDSQFDTDRSVVLQRCKALLVEKMVIPGVVEAQWHKALQLASQHPNIHVAVGLHPLFLKRHQPDDLSRLNQALLEHPEIVAVGEIGLDFYGKAAERTAQLTLLIAQLEIAATFQRPLLLHVRKAHQQMVEQLQQFPSTRGIVHAFSGSYEQAQSYIDAGFLIGIGGVVTRSNAHKLHRIVKKIPLDAIALETDAPDLPPAWARGERNSPEQLPKIAEVVATLQNQTLTEVATQTSRNVSRLLNL